MLGPLFGIKIKEATGCRKKPNDEPHNFYSNKYNYDNKMRKEKWAEHVESIGPVYNVYKTYAGKLKWKRTLESIVDADDRNILNCTLDKYEVWIGSK